MNNNYLFNYVNAVCVGFQCRSYRRWWYLILCKKGIWETFWLLYVCVCMCVINPLINNLIYVYIVYKYICLRQTDSKLKLKRGNRQTHPQNKVINAHQKTGAATAKRIEFKMFLSY